MSYEVELKFFVTDIEQLQQNLQQYSVSFSAAIEESDTFFQHPARDFVKTDECLRIRHRADEFRITYKGPKVDAESKTRREIEIFLTSEEKTALQWSELLMAIGFQPVAEVKKMRSSATIVFREQKFEISLDYLSELGHFVEIETIAAENELAESLKQIKSLATTLNLTKSIRDSYLELLRNKTRYENHNENHKK